MIEGKGRATILAMIKAKVLSTSHRVNLGSWMSWFSSNRSPHFKAR